MFRPLCIWSFPCTLYIHFKCAFNVKAGDLQLNGICFLYAFIFSYHDWWWPEFRVETSCFLIRFSAQWSWLWWEILITDAVWCRVYRVNRYLWWLSMGSCNGKCWADAELRTQETQPVAFHRSLLGYSTSVTTIPENLTTWTITQFSVMPLKINIFKT